MSFRSDSMAIKNILTALALSLLSHISIAGVEELNNTEMTEAYIKDGSIVIKQRLVKVPAKEKLSFIVGPGEATVTEVQKVTIINQNNTAQYKTINQELIRDQESQKRVKSDLYQISLDAQIPATMTTAQQAQQQYAQDLVRNGLGLPAGTEITAVKMGEYLASFNGSTYGDVLGAHQTVTPDGIQFIIPNLGGQFEAGIYPSGDNSINLETTNSQLILNLLFPKQ
jgi:hypothetical protein